jgi:hypothetical protein
MRKIPYAEGIGHVLWPIMVTRPDALCAVGILAQFVQNPGMVHWNALMRVIAYLNTTKDYWLTFGKGANQLEGYSDANQALQTHRHSILGYTFHMGDGTVTWSLKKQAIVALSSTEAEYVCGTDSHCQGTYLALHNNWRTQFAFRKPNNSSLRQSECYCASEGQQISHMHKAHQYSVSFHS